MVIKVWCFGLLISWGQGDSPKQIKNENKINYINLVTKENVAKFGDDQPSNLAH